jgi:hypothetical protein
MGTTYYIVDPAGRRVLDANKAYFLRDLSGEASPEDVESAGHAPDEEPWSASAANAIAAWIRAVATGGRAWITTEHDYDDGCPWSREGGWTRYELFDDRDEDVWGGGRSHAWPRPDGAAGPVPDPVKPDAERVEVPWDRRPAEWASEDTDPGRRPFIDTVPDDLRLVPR